MSYPNLIIAVIILFLNSITVLVFACNIVFRLKSAINSETKAELDFYFKLIMLSVIGIIMAVIAFYIGMKIWLRTAHTALEHITNLRLVYAVLMTAFSGIVSIVDRNYNPFKTR